MNSLSSFHILRIMMWLLIITKILVTVSTLSYWRVIYVPSGLWCIWHHFTPLLEWHLSEVWGVTVVQIFVFEVLTPFINKLINSEKSSRWREGILPHVSLRYEWAWCAKEQKKGTWSQEGLHLAWNCNCVPSLLLTYPDSEQRKRTGTYPTGLCGWKKELWALFYVWWWEEAEIAILLDDECTPRGDRFKQEEDGRAAGRPSVV